MNEGKDEEEAGRGWMINIVTEEMGQLARRPEFVSPASASKKRKWAWKLL